jgi:hypothetical protein
LGDVSEMLMLLELMCIWFSCRVPKQQASAHCFYSAARLAAANKLPLIKTGILTCMCLQFASNPPVNTTTSISSSPVADNRLLHLHVLRSCMFRVLMFNSHDNIR